jgi:DNA repair protein RadC
MIEPEFYTMTGPEPWGDAELLALVLGGREPLVAAAHLLEVFSSLSDLALEEPMTVAERAGISLPRAVRAHAALALGRRAVVQAGAALAHLADADDAARIFRPRLAHLAREELHAAFLDRRNRVLAIRTLTTGSAAYTIVEPAHVFRVALAVRAEAVVLAHNHPSGDPRPSVADVEITRRVAEAGRVVGISLLDHVIIGEDEVVSLAARGAVPRYEASRPALAADPA